MKQRLSNSFNNSDLKELHTSLHYLNMTELKETCIQFGLPTTGKKAPLIERIMTFIQTGTVAEKPKGYPDKSKAVKGVEYPLHPKTLIMFGNYKNDAKTRAFMKHLVGEHFHFTAFGQDWMKERWQQGRPPTYAEFAQYWQGEYERRKNKQSPLKQEWAYLNFLRRYMHERPDAPRVMAMNAWEKERLEMVEKAKKIIKEAQMTQ